MDAPADKPVVTLREVTRENVRDVIRLQVRADQREHVAANAVSLAQAYVHDEAWPRAIYAEEAPVGFLMLELVPAKREYGLWRLLIAENHQGRGYGRAALELAIEHVRSLPGAKELMTSHVTKDGHAGPFYEACGFAYTGEVDGGERIMRLSLGE